MESNIDVTKIITPSWYNEGDIKKLLDERYPVGSTPVFACERIAFIQGIGYAIQKYESQLPHKEFSFDEFKTFIGSIDVPAQRFGIFDIQINNRGRKYKFSCLKESASNNVDQFGFSLNHYMWYEKPKCKHSKFHDEEDVNVSIPRSEFKKAYKEQTGNVITLVMRTWNATITWDKSLF